MTALSMLAAAAVALPIGLWLGHRGRGAFVATAIANAGRAIPSFAILGLAFPLALRLHLGLGFWPTFAALFALALPPILVNAYTGVGGVDRATVEAARGMGMSGVEVLWRVEVPLATPIILEGLRVAAVQVVATASLGALVAWGGLGRYVVDGFALQDRVMTFAGALLIAVLAVLTAVVFQLIERVVVPKPLRRLSRRARRAPQELGDAQSSFSLS